VGKNEANDRKLRFLGEEERWDVERVFCPPWFFPPTIEILNSKRLG
jgi:hypothetical protein